MDDITLFQEENSDNPPTLSHLDMDDEISINNELTNHLTEGNDFGVDEDEDEDKDGKEEEDDDDDEMNKINKRQKHCQLMRMNISAIQALSGRF